MKTVSQFYARCYESVLYSVKMVALVLIAIPVLMSLVSVIAKYIPLVGKVIASASSFVGSASTVVGVAMLCLAGAACIARLMNREA